MQLRYCFICVPDGLRSALAVLIVVLFLLSLVCTSRAQPTDLRAHDPVMIEQDGTYYVFATGWGINVFESEDMRTWDRLAPVFEEAPAWTDDVVPGFRGHIWAPDVVFHEGTYYLYYSVSRFGTNNSAIGVATNTTLDAEDPGFAWVDRGIVVESVPGRDLWNAIDPAVAFDAAGTPWLAFGSYWNGLKVVRLDDSMTEIAQPEQWQTVAARHRYWKLDERDAGDEMNSDVEAPFIFKKDGYYYLFASWDRCCSGEESTYRIVVGRSEKITGPYLDQAGQDMAVGGGTVVVTGNDDWPGVGHSAAYTFDGTDYLVFHGYEAAEDGRPRLWIEELQWDAHGWPYVTLDE